MRGMYFLAVCLVALGASWQVCAAPALKLSLPVSLTLQVERLLDLGLQLQQYLYTKQNSFVRSHQTEIGTSSGVYSTRG